jgi:DNA-binding MarR family transcriptional regulator
MSSVEQFKEKFRLWTEIFMSRSMADTVRFVKHSDMSFAQFGTLMQLYHVHQCGVTDIAGRLGVTSAAASQLTDKLVQSGMIERTEDEHDRRVKQLTLTAKGREWVEQGMQARLGWTADLAESLTPQQRADAIRMMDDLIAAVQTLPAPESAPVE